MNIKNKLIILIMNFQTIEITLKQLKMKMKLKTFKINLLKKKKNLIL